MKTQIVKTFSNFKGGTNNLNTAQVLNDRLQVIKSFTSLKSMETVEKKAIKFKKIFNKKNMETHLKTNRNLILTQNDDGNIAVIACAKGKAKQITDKIEEVIKEHYSVDTVIVTDSYTIFDDSEPQEFSAHIFEDGEDRYETFKLEFITVY